MPKPKPKDKKVLSDLDKERQRVLKRFFDLDEKALSHIKDSLIATRICSYCTAEGKAAKLDENQKCLECHGTMLVPDVQRRNWATDEVVSRVAPKPKAVEMQMDDKRDIEGLAKDLSNKTNEEIEQLAKSIGIEFGEKTE